MMVKDDGNDGVQARVEVFRIRIFRIRTMLMHRHVIADLIRNPEGWQGDTGEQAKTTTYRHSRVGGNPQG